MSDPYAQFDTEGSDPYAQFDNSGSAPQTQPRPVYDAIDGKLVPVGSPADVAAQSPVSGMSDTQLAMAGAGKAQVDLWHGVKQLFGDEPKSAVDDAQARDAPLMHTMPGALGYMGGATADAVLPAGLASDAARVAGAPAIAGALGGLSNPATYGAAAASGALQGAVQPVGTGGSRLWNTASGAVLGSVGQGLARGVSGASDLVTGAVSDSANKAVKALTDAGVPLDAAQRTGSILLQRAKAMLSDNPLTAGAQKDFRDMQARSVTRAFLKTIGEDGNAATPEVMGRAMTRLGNTYQDVFNKLSLPYDKVEQPLSAIVDNARLTMNDHQFSVIQRNADDILNKAAQNGGIINGEQYQNIKQTLDRLSGGGDSAIGESARDIREALHGGLLQHANDIGDQSTVDLLKKTNQQWRNMRTIEGAIDKDGNGMISPARVANILGQKANRSVSIYGKGDTSLADLAHAANGLIPDKTPNSGTMSRIAASSALPLAVGGIEAFRSGDIKRGAELGLGTFALPKLVQMGLNSQGGVARGAAEFLGALGKRSDLPALIGGSLQHVPGAALAALANSLDTTKPNRPAK